MYRFHTRTALCIALLAASPLAFAAAPQATGTGATTAPGAPHHDGKRGNMHGAGQQVGLFQRLDLTEAQRTSFRQMIRDSFQQVRPAMESLRQQRRAFNTATPGTSDYQTLANKLAEAEATASRNEILREADLRTRMYNALTPAQRTKLATLVTERKQQMEQRRARMQEPRSGAPASSPR